VNALDAQTLHRLLQTYETAIAELRAMGDPGVEPLIVRFRHLREEATAALAGG
jgi:hypothetical protein